LWGRPAATLALPVHVSMWAAPHPPYGPLQRASEVRNSALDPRAGCPACGAALPAAHPRRRPALIHGPSPKPIHRGCGGRVFGPSYSWLATRLSEKRAYAAQHRTTTYPVGCNSAWPRHCHWGRHEATDMIVCCGIRCREQMPCTLVLEQQQEEQRREGYASGAAETV